MRFDGPPRVRKVSSPLALPGSLTVGLTLGTMAVTAADATLRVRSAQTPPAFSSSSRKLPCTSMEKQSCWFF